MMPILALLATFVSNAKNSNVINSVNSTVINVSNNAMKSLFVICHAKSYEIQWNLLKCVANVVNNIKLHENELH